MGAGGRLGGRVVVIGAGIAGLCAARVVADHVEEVVVLERDRGPVGDGPRPGVPQGRHFHALLPGGRDALEAWFPGFVGDLESAGSIAAVNGRDLIAWRAEGRSYDITRHQPEPMPLGRAYVQRRPLLEACIRRRVQQLPNVALRFGAAAARPLLAGTRVAGVVTTAGEELGADLVVDTSGHGSCTVRWTRQLGLPPVPESHVDCDVRYSSVLVEPRRWDAFEGVILFVLPVPDGEGAWRSGSLVKLDGGHWLAGLAGRYDDAPPVDWEGFRAYGASLPWPVWDELVGTASPVERVAPYRVRRATRRHYERDAALPEGLLPLGDAICSFNPAYGQGMSVAAGQCRALEAVLVARAEAGGGLDGLAAEVLPEAVEWARGPWAMAALLDFAHPRCTGDRPQEALGDLARLAELVARAPNDPAAARVALHVSSLKAPLSLVRTVAPPGPGAGAR